MTLLALIIKLVLFAAGGFYKAIMDKLQFHYGKSVFPQADGEKFLFGSRQYWDPKISWRNKYKDGKPENGSKFPLSTSVLVFLTDGWHFAQFWMLTAFAAAVVPPTDDTWRWLGMFMILRIAFAAVFHFFFHTILERKQPDEVNQST